MKALLLLLLLLSSPSALLYAPDSVNQGETFKVVISIKNTLNETLRADVVMVSPYKLSWSLTLSPGESKNVSAIIDSGEYRVGEKINVTVVIFFSRPNGSDTLRLQKLITVTSGPTDLKDIIIGLAILTIGVSVVGYLALAVKKKREEKQEERIRPPWL